MGDKSFQQWAYLFVKLDEIGVTDGSDFMVDYPMIIQYPHTEFAHTSLAQSMWMGNSLRIATAIGIYDNDDPNSHHRSDHAFGTGVKRWRVRFISIAPLTSIPQWNSNIQEAFILGFGR